MAHHPLRTCVGCRVRTEQVRLVRFARAGEGWVRDPARVRGPGRGAYLCSRRCAERALKNKRYAALGRVALAAEWDGV